MSDYQQRREQLIADLTPADQAVFDEAYATAGLSMDLAATVYDARRAADLTQTELARRMGTTQSAIAAIESGARTPTVDLLERLARVCGRRLTISIDSDDGPTTSSSGWSVRACADMRSSSASRTTDPSPPPMPFLSPAGSRRTAARLDSV